MSRMLRALVTVVLGGLLAAGCGTPKEEALATPPITFSVSLAKTDFQPGEPIVLTMTLRNTSANPVAVNSRMAVNDKSAPRALREVFVDITAPSGKRARFRWDVTIELPAQEDFADLGPDATVERRENLTRRYRLQEHGDYSLVATYENTRRGPQVINDQTGDISQTDIGAVRAKLQAPDAELPHRLS